MNSTYSLVYCFPLKTGLGERFFLLLQDLDMKEISYTITFGPSTIQVKCVKYWKE